MLRNMYVKKAFTLVEIIVVLVIISLMAGFGIPAFSKAIINARKTDAVNNLKIIHSASMLLKSRTGSYPSASNLTQINNILKLNIISNDNNYECSGGSCEVCSDDPCDYTTADFAYVVSLYSPIKPETASCPNPRDANLICITPPVVPPHVCTVDESGTPSCT